MKKIKIDADLYIGDEKLATEKYVTDNCTTFNNIIEDGAAVNIETKVDANSESWTQWNKRLAFGITTDTAPVPFNVYSQEFIKGTLITNNTGDPNYNRWGCHIFEGYSTDNYSRITLLLDKHVEENKKTAEMYYYTGASHFNKAYGWFRIGSDVADHSFLFSRDKCIVSIADINTDTDIDSTYNTIDEADSTYEPDDKSIQNNKCVLYLEMKNARDGAFFYDSKRHVPVMRIDGKWCDLAFTESPTGLYPEPPSKVIISYINVTSSTGDDDNKYGYIGAENILNTDDSHTSIYSIVFQVVSGYTYTIKKEGQATNRFKVATMSDTTGTDFNLLFTDESKTEFTFDSSVSGYCICTYTVSSETCTFTVTETQN